MFSSWFVFIPFSTRPPTEHLLHTEKKTLTLLNTVYVGFLCGQVNSNAAALQSEETAPTVNYQNKGIHHVQRRDPKRHSLITPEASFTTQCKHNANCL